MTSLNYTHIRTQHSGSFVGICINVYLVFKHFVKQTLV